MPRHSVHLTHHVARQSGGASRYSPTRRAAVLALISHACLVPPSPAALPRTVQLPLEQAAGGVLTTGLFIDGERFRVIIDSGSPYLVLPAEEACERQPPRLSAFGCAAPGQFRPTGLASTSEQYGVLRGRVDWLTGDLAFGETELGMEADGRLFLRLIFEARQQAGGPVVFGAADRNVMGQSGGALLGLIRDVNREPISTIPQAELRPTALTQLGLSAFCIDAPRRTLTLSSTPLIGAANDALPLVDPRPYGDGVEHVCCRVDGDELVVDGVRLKSRRPILCVFDSGLTGICLSQSLVDELGLGRRVTPQAGQRDGGVKSLRVPLRSERGRRVLLDGARDSSPYFYVQAVSLDWFVDTTDGPHVVAVGQCVLARGALSVDLDGSRALWRPGATLDSTKTV